MRREIRKNQIRKRKNFFPLLAITLFLWISLLLIIVFVDPDTFGAVPVFFTIVFATLFFSLTTIFINVRRGLITAAAITLFIILRYFGVGNIVNLILITATALAFELYFWYTSH
ncbi:MAG TPA: hypothetical protein VF185_01000 [Patescibacteria group bacterium]